jgi:hypothetical protein
MHLSIRHTLFLAAAFALLLTGAIQYISLQPTSWIAHFFPSTPVQIHLSNNHINDLIRFHLSDITWATALYTCVVVLAEKMRISLRERCALLSLPFITELLQKLHIINGTFDWFDMLCYEIVLSLFLLIFPHLIHYNYEKN